MNPTRHHLLRRALPLLFAAAGLVPSAAPAKEASDINPPEKRREVVDLALKLSKMTPLRPLPGKLPQPFAPPNFDMTDADERAAALAAGKTAAGQGKEAPPAPPSERDTLVAITSRIAPSGTISVGDSPMLLFGKKFVKVGAHLTVMYKGIPYDLELVSIDRTTFTLRLNHEEITRPIQPGKKP